MAEQTEEICADDSADVGLLRRGVGEDGRDGVPREEIHELDDAAEREAEE